MSRPEIENAAGPGGNPYPVTDPPRVPAVHRPYLVAVALAALAQGAVLFVERSEGFRLAFMFLALALVIVHFVWLFTLLRDAKARLGPDFVIPPGAGLFVGFLVIFVVQVGTSLVLAAVGRAALRAEERRRPGGAHELARHRSDLLTLVPVSLLVTAVTAFQQVKEAEFLDLYRDDAAPGILGTRILGDTGALLVAAIYVVGIGFYVAVLARWIPALYRSYGRSRSADLG